MRAKQFCVYNQEFGISNKFNLNAGLRCDHFTFGYKGELAADGKLKQ